VTLDEISKPLSGVVERARRRPEGVRAKKRDRHTEIVEQRANHSAAYRKTFARTLHPD